MAKDLLFEIGTEEVPAHVMPGTLAQLKENAEKAFRAAHTLKGICLNLGLKNLYTVSSDLTEKLRGRELDGYEALYEKVSEQYKITVNALKSVE